MGQTPPDNVPSAKNVPKTKISVLAVKYISFAVFFIAEDEGYFADEGLEIQYVPMSRGFDGIPALAQGKLDVWNGGINVGMFNVIARGADIRIVADKGYVRVPDDATFTLVIRTELIKSGRVAELKDLKGLCFSHQTGTSGDYGITRLLEKAGLKKTDIRAVSLSNELIPQAMAEGTIDAALLTQPWATIVARQGVGIKWKQMPEIVPDFQYGLIAFGPTLLRDNPDAGVRFIRAYLRAVRQLSKGKTDRNMEIVVRHTELEPDLLRETGWTIIRPDGRPGMDSIMDFQKWAVESGFQDAVLQPEQFWDPRFVEAAAASMEKAPE